eukprot:Polyplicarium_translucidae@DN1402_c0_g1_i2.p1
MNVVPQVMREGGVEDKGETARLQYFVGAIAIGDLVKTTLGPKGMDKILQPMPDMRALGVMESYKSKLSQICAAAEAAEMIVRVDDIIRCAPRERRGM